MGRIMKNSETQNQGFSLIDVMRRAVNKKLTTLTVIGVALSISNVAMATTGPATMTVSATLAEACSVSSATMIFPPFSRFTGTDIAADSAGTLLITCSASTTPLIWSDSTRVLSGPGAAEIPFSLSQRTATASTDALPTISTGQAIAAPFVANGTEQSVALHGLIKAADYMGKAPGLYTTSIKMNVDY
jgi:spore coat protein U-like protein